MEENTEKVSQGTILQKIGKEKVCVHKMLSIVIPDYLTDPKKRRNYYQRQWWLQFTVEERKEKRLRYKNGKRQKSKSWRFKKMKSLGFKDVYFRESLQTLPTDRFIMVVNNIMRGTIRLI